MKKLKIFKDLFVLDLANNHQGSKTHAIKIIREFAKINQKLKKNIAIKFQFRDLETFIHQKYINSNKNKHIKRFTSTKLSKSDWIKIFNEVKRNGFKTMCTPFDENSLKLIEELNFDIVKIASCSANDWPLLEEVYKLNKPIILSTGGLQINQIDKIYSFLKNKSCDFAFMHCVSIYPTPNSKMNINFIATLKDRYSDIDIGWSTHEDPNDTSIIQLAFAKGATIFERHIGLKSKKISLNAYSSTPKQIVNWIQSYNNANTALGNEKKSVIKEENNSLNDLKRGVYAKENIKSGKIISYKDVYFAMPLQKNQLSVDEWSNNGRLINALKINKPLLKKNFIPKRQPLGLILKKSYYEYRAMLNKAKIKMSSDFTVEFSHHYGIKKFNKFGALIINCINREYCKKLILMLPNQFHPHHYHKRKEETFQLLYGDCELHIEDKTFNLQEGQTALVQPGVWHNFKSSKGCIIEEVSTTHYKNDSVYKDYKIQKLKTEERKTYLENWGRYELIK